MSEGPRFETEKALEYAASIARPRLVGTAEHDKVADELAARLAQWGYQVERQPFEFSTALNALLALTLFINCVCLTVMVVLRQSLPGVTTVGALVILTVLVLAAMMGRSISNYAVSCPKCNMA